MSHRGVDVGGIIGCKGCGDGKRGRYRDWAGGGVDALVVLRSFAIGPAPCRLL